MQYLVMPVIDADMRNWVLPFVLPFALPFALPFVLIEVHEVAAFGWLHCPPIPALLVIRSRHNDAPTSRALIYDARKLRTIHLRVLRLKVLLTYSDDSVGHRFGFRLIGRHQGYAPHTYDA